MLSMIGFKVICTENGETFDKDDYSIGNDGRLWRLNIGALEELTIPNTTHKATPSITIDEVEPYEGCLLTDHFDFSYLVKFGLYRFDGNLHYGFYGILLMYDNTTIHPIPKRIKNIDGNVWQSEYRHLLPLLEV